MAPILTTNATIPLQRELLRFAKSKLCEKGVDDNLSHL